MSERQVSAPIQQIKKQRPSFHLFDFFYQYGTILTIVVLIVVLRQPIRHFYSQEISSIFYDRSRL